MAEVRVQAIGDISVIVIWVDHLTGVAIRSVLEATIEISCGDETQIRAAHVLRNLVNVRPSISSVNVVGARGDGVDLGERNAP